MLRYWPAYLVTAVLLAIGFFLPAWLLVHVAVAAGKGMVVLGLLLLLRSGLVSFGQGLYFCLGAYAIGMSQKFLGINDVLLLMLMATLVCGLLALLLGFLLSNYRGIFFSMLSLAFSMVLWGLLSKIQWLGSTDGFDIQPLTLFGYKPDGDSAKYAVYALSVIAGGASAVKLHHYLLTPLGRLSEAIRDNEIRVEYMGASVRLAIHVKYVIAAVLAGLGGAVTALTIGHVDPEMAYWTTSGEFVFVNILSGASHVVAPYLGSLIFETIRTFAYQYSPNTWQMVLGSAMLAVILFLPEGLWSVFHRRRKEAN